MTGLLSFSATQSPLAGREVPGAETRAKGGAEGYAHLAGLPLCLESWRCEYSLVR